MLDLACLAKLASWACTAASFALKSSDLDDAALLADLGARSIEAGHALHDRPRDVVRKAADRLARHLERDHRIWLEREFGADVLARQDMEAIFAALDDVLQKTLPSAEEVAHANLNASAIADQVAEKAGADEQFRKGTFGGRLLRALVVHAYQAALHDESFARELRLAIDQVLLMRSQQTLEITQRIEAMLIAGTAQLSLDARHRLRAPPTNERELLLTELRATTLVGRDAELTSLQAWLNTPRPITVRCLTGRAGAGKTRLAIELCERAEADGWAAGFARHEELLRFNASHSPAEWRWDRKTLVVVDYAAASIQVLRPWLEALARRQSDPAVPTLRVLLLERHADTDAGWWTELARPRGLSERGPSDLLDPPEPLPIGALTAVADRRELLTQVMSEAAQLRGVAPAPVPPAPGLDALFDQKLADDRIENEPLYLVMAGLAAVDIGAPAALALGRLDLAEQVAEAERNRLVRLARRARVDERLVLHLAACVTLQNGSDDNAIRALVHRERAALADRSSTSTDQLVALLHGALTPPGGIGVDAVRPDLIGEAFLLTELGRDHRSPARQAAIVERAFRRAGPPVVATVIRTAQDHARGDSNHPSVVWLDHLARLTDDPFVLMAIAGELPEQTLALRERAAEITARIVDLLAPRVTTDPELIPLRAGWLNNLGVRLSELGQREAALAAAQEALALYRTLAPPRVDAFRPDLAMSLNNLANRLSELGQREAALAATQEALALYRALIARRHDAFRPNLATSLNNLANMLSDLGQREAALAAAQEALVLRRALAAQQPDAFKPNLATSLNNLALILSELGQREAALAAAQEAVMLYRVLAVQRPDAFRPDLAASLNNLASTLSELGQREAALAAALEAVALYRGLATQRPEAFRPDLAVSLNNLAAMMSELGQREAALAAAQEAVSLRRALAAQRPTAFQPDLARSLNNLATMLSEVGEQEVALAAAQEAVTLYRALAWQRPDAFRSDLAASLSNLANRLSELGEQEAALETAREAVELYRILAAQRPDAFRPHLASSLNNMAAMLNEAGQHEDALSTAGEAISFYRTLAAQRPDAFQHYLAISLMVQAQCLDAVAEPEGGASANAEAIAVLRDPFLRRPQVFASLMRTMVNEYTERCQNLGTIPDEAVLTSIATVLANPEADQREHADGTHRARPEGDLRPTSIGSQHPQHSIP